MSVVTTQPETFDTVPAAVCALSGVDARANLVWWSCAMVRVVFAGTQCTALKASFL
jgi:hypothetical protein